MILVDTGPIVAAASKRDEHHATCLAALGNLREPALITPLVVMEVCYFLSTRATAAAEAAFLRSIAVGSFDLVTLTKDDLERTAQLVERYADLPLGSADASIIAVAERLDVRRVLTLDPPTSRSSVRATSTPSNYSRDAHPRHPWGMDWGMNHSVIGTSQQVQKHRVKAESPGDGHGMRRAHRS